MLGKNRLESCRGEVKADLRWLQGRHAKSHDGGAGGRMGDGVVGEGEWWWRGDIHEKGDREGWVYRLQQAATVTDIIKNLRSVENEQRQDIPYY